MMSPCRFISHNKFTTVVGDVDIGRGCACVGTGYIGNLCTFLSVLLRTRNFSKATPQKNKQNKTNWGESLVSLPLQEREHSWTPSSTSKGLPEISLVNQCWVLQWQLSSVINKVVVLSYGAGALLPTGWGLCPAALLINIISSPKAHCCTFSPTVEGLWRCTLHCFNSSHSTAL